MIRSSRSKQLLLDLLVVLRGVLSAVDVSLSYWMVLPCFRSIQTLSKSGGDLDMRSRVSPL
jgi:hypothetical protein